MLSPQGGESLSHQSFPVLNWARDHVDTARRAKDAERDGRTGTGRTDMLAGDLMPGGEVRVREADPISPPSTSQAVPDGGSLGESLGASAVGQTAGRAPDLAALVDTATQQGRSGNKAFATYRKIEGEEAQRLGNVLGANVEGFEHGADESAIRHVLKEHGDSAKEEVRGQVAVTREDIENLPIYTDPERVDSIVLGSKGPMGVQTVVYKTRVNGHVVAVEEVRVGRNRFALKTMWKVRAAPSASNASLSQTSETLGTQPSTAESLPHPVTPQSRSGRRSAMQAPASNASSPANGGEIHVAGAAIDEDASEKARKQVEREVLFYNTRSRLTRAYNGEPARGSDKVEDYANLREELEQVAAGEGEIAEIARSVLENMDGAIANYELAKKYHAKNAEGESPLLEHTQKRTSKVETNAAQKAQLSALLRQHPEAGNAYRAWNRARVAAINANWADAESDAVIQAEEALLSMPGGEAILGLHDALEESSNTRTEGERLADSLGLREAVDKVAGNAGVEVLYITEAGDLEGKVRPGILARFVEKQNGRRKWGMGRAAGVYVPADATTQGKPLVAILVEQNGSPAQAAFTAAHEISGHHGLRTLLGDSLNRALEIAEQNPTVKAVAESMMRQRELKPNQRLLAVEEALADLAAAVRTGDYARIEREHGVHVPEGMRRESLKAAIANFLKRLKALFSQKGVAFSDAQVRQLLDAAHQASQRGSGITASVLKGNGLLEQVEPTSTATSERAATERAYGGRAAYDKAKAEGRTKLTFQQWVDVRTPSFKRWFGDWEAVQHQEFLDGKPVKELLGDEFAPDGVPLTEKVPRWYKEQGVSTVAVDGIGDVALDAVAVKNSMSHGIGRDKATAFAAVPDVLRKGRIIHRDFMRGSRDAGMVYHVAAPIEIAGKVFVMDVLVKADANASRMYVHEVVLKEKLQQSVFKTGADAAEAGVRAGTDDAGAIRSVLQRIYGVNPAKVSKVIDPATGEPLVVYHGTNKDFSEFDKGADSDFDYGDAGANGFFFTSDPSYASYYAGSRVGSNLMPVFLSVKNAVTLIGNPDLKQQSRKLSDAKESGHDGAVIGNDEYVAFESNQIKSATGNTGAFDGENPDIRYSKATDAAQGGHSQARKAEVQGHVDAIRAKWKNAPEVVVVADMQDAAVPQAVRDADAAQRSQGAQGSPEGFFYQGKVYLIASELPTAEDAARVLLHEALGHYGLRGVFGQKLVTMLDELARHRQKDVVAKAREYGLHGLGDAKAARASDAEVWASMSQRQKLEAAEEVLAEMAQQTPELGWVRRAVAAIRTWLREHVPGLANLSMTDAEIINRYLLPARRFVELGEGRGRDGQTPFSRSAMKDGDANIRRGREALAKAVTEKTSVHRAMYRNGLGWVDFVWGDEGRVLPNGRTVGGSGLAHIIEARQRKDAMSHSQVNRLLDNLVQTIAKGSEIGRTEIRGSINLRIGHEGNLAVLVKNPGSNAWMLTGFEMKPSGEAGVGFDAASPMHSKPTPTRHAVGAEGRPGAAVAANDASRATHKPADSSDQTVGAGNATLPDSGDEGNPRFSRKSGVAIERAERAPREVVKDIDAAVREVMEQVDGKNGPLMERARAKLADMTPAKLKDAWRGTWLGALTLRHLTELGRDYFSGIAIYDEYRSKMSAHRNRLQQESNDVAEDVRMWAAKNVHDAKALFDLMHEATIDGNDPAEDYQPLQFRYGWKLYEVTHKNVRDAQKEIRKQKMGRAGESGIDLMERSKALGHMLKAERRRKRNYPALRARWEALPEEAKAHYVAMRDMYKARSEETEAALIERINDLAMENAARKRVLVDKIRQHFESQRLQGVYFPLQRYGQYFVAAERDGGNTFLMFESLNKAEAAAGFDAASPMHSKPTPTRHAVGAEGSPGGANAGRATLAPTRTAASLTRDSVGAGNATLPDSGDEGNPLFSRTDAQARSAANIAKAHARNEARREEARQTLVTKVKERLGVSLSPLSPSRKGMTEGASITQCRWMAGKKKASSISGEP